MAFNYKEGQVSWCEAIRLQRVHEPIQFLLGTIDDNLKINISDSSVSGRLKLALKLIINKDYAVGTYEYLRDKDTMGTTTIVNIIGKSSINELLEIPNFGGSSAFKVYEYYAQFATFDLKKSEVVEVVDVLELPISFADQIKPFSVIDTGDKIMLNILGSFIPFSKILRITSFETDGVETGLSFSFKNPAKIIEGPHKGLQRGKMMTLSVLYSDMDDIERNKFLDLIGKRDCCII
jgi:hypothetical protein